MCSAKKFQRAMQTQLLLERAISAILDAISDGSDTLCIQDALHSVALLEKTCGRTSFHERRSKQTLQDLEESLSHSSAPRQDFDAFSILQNVKIAEEARVAKLEHETMAKLVNKLRDRTELVEGLESCQSCIKDMTGFADSLDERLSQRFLAARVLSQLIPAIQASLSEIPPQENLPPLDEIDASLFNLG